MSLGANLRLRFVLIAVGALVAVAAGTMMLSRAGRNSSAPPKQIKPLHPAQVHATRTKPAASPHKVHAHGVTPPARTKPKVSARHAVPMPASPGMKTVPVTPALPPSVARALRKNRVVVVQLFSRGAGIDTQALNESSAGARAVAAGFVALDVESQREALPLVKSAGVLHDPALLVYRRPGRLMLVIDGFADHETVAQAAANFGAKAPHRAKHHAKHAAGKHPAKSKAHAKPK